MFKIHDIGHKVSNGIYTDSIDVTGSFIRFPQPKVVLEKPLNIDQMTLSAKSRLRVFIEAEFGWLQYKLSKEFKELQEMQFKSSAISQDKI